MTRTAAFLVVLGLALLAAVLWYLGRREQEPSRDEPAIQEITPPPAESSADGTPETLLLYFLSPSGFLRAETRPLASPPPASAEGLAVQALRALLAGSEDPDLVSPLDSSVEVVSVVVAAGGVAYVDLRSAAAATPPSSGSRLEMLRVYSLVNTVLGNLVTAEKAVILWNGTQLGTFAGHLDLGRPLAFRDDLVEPPGRRS
jgi:hypothetical protein